MNTIQDQIHKPEFNQVRELILKMGVDDPFFDKDAFWGGYTLQQNSYEFASFVLFLKERFPNGMSTYAEIGTAGGGMLRAMYELIGFKNAISIDDGQWRAEVYPLNEKFIKSPIKRLVVNSHTPIAREFLSETTKQIGCDFMFIDGDHSYEGVLQDFYMVKSILPKGSLIGFHDICCVRTPGVTKFYQQQKGFGFKTLAEFVIDEPNRMGIAVCEV